MSDLYENGGTGILPVYPSATTAGLKTGQPWAAVLDFYISYPSGNHEILPFP
jgi:hypothetical protein